MNKKLKFISIIILILLALQVAFGVYYVNDYYHAEDEISDYLNGTDNVNVIKTSMVFF